MPRSPRRAPAALPEPDHLKVTALGVGHGDAVLIRWKNDGRTWTCLVDGGQSPETLTERLTHQGVERLDLLVLTHLDFDHAGGLAGLARSKKFPITQYWGPVLPAFERLRALFGAGCNAAIKRGRELEEELREAGVSILYPLEGHQSAPLGNQGLVSVLSPAPRLIRRLLTGDDVLELFVQHSSAWGWLLDPPPERDEQEPHLVRLDAALAHGALEPEEDLEGFPSRPVATPREWGRTMEERCFAWGVEPEFFGDWVMNNTSLVLYLEFRTGSRTHTVLLPGDQEDWTYLLARHPRGLQAEVLKASHHGGRVFLGTDQAHDEVFSSIRPTVVLFSGNGDHGLPRAAVREAALRWGASVTCTCSRKMEFFTCAPVVEPPRETCCRVIHECETGRDVTLVMDQGGIWSEQPACSSGHGTQPGPTIVMRQHVVDPSPILQDLAEQELLGHIRWVKKRLEGIHQDRVGARQGELGSSEPVPLEMLEDLAREAGRSHMVPHLQEVLRQGMWRGRFWAAVKPHDRSVTHAYARPRREEINEFLGLLERKETLLFTKAGDPVNFEKDTLIHSLDKEGLARFAETHLLLPKQAFRETLWPDVAKFLKRPRWHCYYREHQGVAFSARSEVKGFILGVLEALRGESEWMGNSDSLFRRSDLPFLAPVWLDDLVYYRPSPYAYCSPLERWFFPDFPMGNLTEVASAVVVRIRKVW